MFLRSVQYGIGTEIERSNSKMGQTVSDIEHGEMKDCGSQEEGRSLSGADEDLEMVLQGQVPLLTPVIPALWEAKASRSPEVRNSRPAWPTW